MATVPYAHISQGPAVIRPIGPPVVVAPRRTINPLLPICCAGLLLFLVASTIILALIPVYVERRIDRVQSQQVPFTALYQINNGTLPVGALSTANCQAIQQDQQSFTSSSGSGRSSTPTTTQCAVTGNTTMGRRRRQLSSSVGNLMTVNGFISGTSSCRRGNCLTNRANKFIASLRNRGTFFLTLIGADGTPLLLSLTLISASISSAVTGSTSATQNDIAILNYALVLEQLESTFYTRFQNTFKAQDFIAANLTQRDYDYFNIIYVHEMAHVRALSAIITQLGGTPVPPCTYNFSIVTDPRTYASVARLLETTGTMAYDGAASGLADTTLRQIAATVATVEGRHAAYLNTINGLSPFPSSFETPQTPMQIIQAAMQFIVSCPFTITPPTVPYIGSSSFTGTIPTTNSASTGQYTNAMYTNDIRALNYALVTEQLEATYYNTFVSRFTSSDYTSNGFSDASNYFIMIREHENAHVQFLRMTITQRGGTPVSVCTYNFTVANVSQFVQTSRTFENTGVSAYDGAINTISDPNLITGAATIATVEARHASYLNLLVGAVPFPNITDPTLTPTQVISALAPYQMCPFTPDPPVVLNPSSFVPSG